MRSLIFGIIYICYGVKCQSYDPRLSAEGLNLTQYNQDNSVSIPYVPLRRWYDQWNDNATIERYGLMYPDLYSSMNITYSSVPYNTTSRNIFNGRVSNITLNIPITIYVPKTYVQNNPIIIIFHGGGFVFSSRYSVHASAAHLSNLTGAIFVNVEYRLAPENKFPYGLDDSKHVVEFVIQNKLRFSPLAGNASVGLMGTSAGGNFASVIANEFTNRKVDFLISVYSFLNVIIDTPAYVEFNRNVSNLAATLNGVYFNSTTFLVERNSTRFHSPFGVTSLTPKSLLVASEIDVFRDDTVVLLKQAYEENSVPFQAYTIAGMIHGFFTQPDVVPNTILQLAGYVKDFLANLPFM